MNLLIPATIVIIGLLAGGIVKTGSDLVDGLKFQIDPFKSIKGFGISKGMMEFPVAVNIINPTPTGMPLDSIFATIYKKAGTEWEMLGSSQPNLTNLLIKPNATTAINFTVKVPLLSAASEIFNIISNLTSIQSQEDSQKGTYKVEVRIGVQGQTLTQNFEQKV